MARISAYIMVKMPWCYSARITTLAALAKAGFAIDISEEAKAIVAASSLTVR